MSTNSSIEWTQATWNPVTGCTRASAGCDNCYAVRHSYRMEHCGQAKYSGLTVLNKKGERHFNGVIKCHDEELAKPFKWKKPQVIFVNSMSDLFHANVPTKFIEQVFAVMSEANWHTFQILTKRPERAEQLSSLLPWPENVWLGTSVEDASVTDRIRHLQRTSAAIKFLSCEPLIGPLAQLQLSEIDWVITGGESGPGARPMEGDWVRAIRDRCLRDGVPHFFKQWGKIDNNPDPNDPTAKRNGGNAKGGRTLDGRTWNEFPVKDEVLLF